MTHYRAHAPSTQETCHKFDVYVYPQQFITLESKDALRGELMVLHFDTDPHLVQVESVVWILGQEPPTLGMV